MNEILTAAFGAKSKVLFFFPPEAFFWTVHIAFTWGVPEAHPVRLLPSLVSTKVVVPTPATHASAACSAALFPVDTILKGLSSPSILAILASGIFWTVSVFAFQFPNF